MQREQKEETGRRGEAGPVQDTQPSPISPSMGEIAYRPGLDGVMVQWGVSLSYQAQQACDGQRACLCMVLKAQLQLHTIPTRLLYTCYLLSRL